MLKSKSTLFLGTIISPEAILISFTGEDNKY